jgi:phosphoribosylaminoimidazolecarboxamide formyltransferase / IMP cyclohydrolase
MGSKKINSALVSVYHKDNLEPILKLLQEYNVALYSTGGTYEFIQGQNIKATAIEDVTSYPSILGGRVKTLHPKVMGGILARRDDQNDQHQLTKYEIPLIDLVIVDLYPFEQTVASGASEDEIIEKIDVGGITLIRAAAKNFKDVLIVPSMDHYGHLKKLLEDKKGFSDIEDRRQFATYAFDISSHYDSIIFNYFNKERSLLHFKQSIRNSSILRYGENPHQQGVFYGELEKMFDQLNGKALSYNNLVDIDAAVALIEEFQAENAFAILKHTNACGAATGNTTKEAYVKALEADPVSAFGGVLISNKKIDIEAAEEINKLFFEALIAPGFDDDALTLLKAKKNRIILHQKKALESVTSFKSVLNGVLEQDRDLKTDSLSDFKLVTKRSSTSEENKALVFASKICKHTKSNTIVLAKNGQLIASGVGQTSRVDALKQAIEKARNFNLALDGAVMASDAFFPFADCVEIANNAGIKAVIQPGGSIKDQDSIDYCDNHGMAMVFTGFRHFRH